ncbi:hypothetical protein [Pontivivens insulae]|uniref:DUF304 domain-containing protein n=1 Tax=Pontivivens insulae TaxID=1639689 RepID=A0A2R8ACS2_9RHOB|nr:hypothetical protein [Pontivivens insulae]RED13955.1 hypothetical protein DFR53_1305 [Pontivivens insulae]SPF30029.1 hypothetical protein POI8812_02357 [Pontivivens insulae]
MQIPPHMRAFLASDERLIWHGRPGQGFVFRPALFMFAVVGLIVIVVFGWAGGQIIEQGDVVAGMGFRAFAYLVGGAFVVGPTAVDIYARSKTDYLVTDKGVTILVRMGPVPYTPVKYRYTDMSFSRHGSTLRLIPLQEADGSYRIRFDRPKEMIALRDADHVETLIKSQMATAATPADL